VKFKELSISWVSKEPHNANKTLFKNRRHAKPLAVCYLDVRRVVNTLDSECNSEKEMSTIVHLCQLWHEFQILSKRRQVTGEWSCLEPSCLCIFSPYVVYDISNVKHMRRTASYKLHLPWRRSTQIFPKSKSELKILGVRKWLEARFMQRSHKY